MYIVLDVQDNQITNFGAKIVYNVLQLNTEIQIVDIRNNPQCDSKLLDSIYEALSKNRMFSVLKAQKSEKEIINWTWLDSKDPLKHTFHEMNSKMHVRSQTQSTLKKRSLRTLKPSLSKGSKSKSFVKLNSSMKNSIHSNPPELIKSNPITVNVKGISNGISNHQMMKNIVPLNNKNFKIKSAEPCHKLVLKSNTSKKSKGDNSSALIKENQELRERLSLLESGIASVTRVLKSNPNPNSTKDENQNEEIHQQQDSLKQLIDLMETSLIGFQDMMDSLESRERERRKRKEARRMQKLNVS